MRSPIYTVFALTTAALLACGGSQPAPNPPAAEVDASAPKETNADAGAASAAPASTGSSAAAAPAPSSTGGTAGGNVTPTSPNPNFDALSKDKKVEVMATKVVPTVGKLFKDHDGGKYAKFGCATCHGPSKKNDPHDVLPKLTLSNGGYEKLAKSKPEVMKFMGEKVVPEMAKAMGEQPFDPKTGKGFGCAGCHKVD